ncbi:MAG TPA: hypothetical protein VMV69_18130 [Pirellulales bacterium]|nr:hypothetical protein [Pirellulales bacterium]
MIQCTQSALTATAANQLRGDPHDLAQLCELAHDSGGMLPPRAVVWLLEGYAARQREIAALVSECQDRADESDRLKRQVEALRLRLREMAWRAGAGEPADDERARVEAAARMVC